MTAEIVSVKAIAQVIYLVRRQRVLLDRDLAALYGVETRVLNQAVKRNANRFPEDFMFQLSRQEIARISQSVTSLSGRDRASSQLAISSRSRSQNVILKRGKNVKYLPYAFTEEGVAMLSSVLNSERAVQVNIAIMRAFVRLREILETNRELARKFEELEARVGKHDEQIGSIIEAIRQLMAPRKSQGERSGFMFAKKQRANMACGRGTDTWPPVADAAWIIRRSMLGVGRSLLLNITVHPS
jgi:hypothetical protein